jgi:hypothetical protein
VIVLVGGGVALLVNSGPNTPANTAPQARALFRTTLAAAARQRSFHYVSRYVSGGATQTTIGDAESSSGRQVITIGHDSFTVLVIGSACYFRGDAREIADQLGLSPSASSAHANQWISLAPGDSPYPSVSVAVTSGSALAANIAFRPLHYTGGTNLSGTAVLGITGPMTNVNVNGSVQRAKGTAALYAASARPHLPARYSQRGTVDGQSGTFAMTFSRWGERVPLHAPSGAVAFSSLGPSRTTPPTPTGPGILT